MSSTVDVVVPCHNYGRFLEPCVRSVLAQGLPVRVLIIDDASIDDSLDRAKTIAAHDDRVEVRSHPVNCGHIATYNEGLLTWARARYSLLLSADDLLAGGALARASALLDRHPAVGMVYGLAVDFVDEPPLGRVAAGRCSDYRLVSSERFLERCFCSGNPVPGPTAVVRTQVQQRIGGYRADLPHSGDLEMWMRFAIEGPIGVTRSIQACYRRHGGNMSLPYYSAAIGDRREQIDAFLVAVQRCTHRFPEARTWLAAMRRRMAEEAFWCASDALDAGRADDIEACLAFACEQFPDIRRSRAWWKLHAKRCVGARHWPTLRRAIDALRSVRRPRAAARGEPSGWWPEDVLAPAAGAATTLR